MLKGVNFGGNTLNKRFLILVSVSVCQVTENTLGDGMAVVFKSTTGDGESGLPASAWARQVMQARILDSYI